MSIMGTRVVRTEDPVFLTRGGTYTADVALPGALHLTLVRSPVAHARITSVDVAPPPVAFRYASSTSPAVSKEAPGPSAAVMP